MSIRDSSSGDVPKTAPVMAAGGGQASAKHQGLHRPADDQRIGQALDDVGLEDQGEVLEDELRDRRSSGAPPSQHLRVESGGDAARSNAAGD